MAQKSFFSQSYKHQSITTKWHFWAFFYETASLFWFSLFLLPLSGFWPFSFEPTRAALGGAKNKCKAQNQILVLVITLSGFPWDSLGIVMIKGPFMFTDKNAQSSFNFTWLILKGFFRSFEAISTFKPILFRVQQNKSFLSFSPDE